MKRMVGIMMLLAILAMPAQAQRQGRMRGTGGRNAIGNPIQTRELSADAIIQLRERLDLSEEQVASVKEAQQSRREVQDATRLEIRSMSDRLRDEEITREKFREELERLNSTAGDGLVAYREALEGILTDEQRSQMRDLQRQRNRESGVRSGRQATGRFRDRGQDARQSRVQPGRGNMRPGSGGRALGPRARR